jgi:hypothetical protein
LRDITKFSSPATTPLTLISIIGGATISWVIFPTPIVAYFTTPIKCLILLILTLGLVLGVCLIFSNLLLGGIKISNKILDLLGSIWFIPTLSTRFYSIRYLNLGYLLTYTVDRGWTEYLSVKWIVDKMSNRRNYIQKSQSASLKIHLITFIIWFMFVVLIYLIYLSSLIRAKSWKGLGEH